jgi:hypothetical protein
VDGRWASVIGFQKPIAALRSHGRRARGR